MLRAFLIGLLAISLVAGSTHAMFAMVDEDVPVDQVLTQLDKNVKENPKDAHAHYLLGRVHSLAWATGGDQVQLIKAGGKNGLPDFAAYASLRVQRQDQKPADEKALKHLDNSIASYRKAVELDEKNGLYRLGLAWMLEQKFATDVAKPIASDDKNAPTREQRQAQLQEIIDQYVKAFDLRLEADIKTKDRLMAGDAFVSMEAANNAIRLIKTLNKPDQKLIDKLEAGVAKVAEQPMAITPVIISLQPGGKLVDLIDSKATVAFDLAGLGTNHKWPWVNQQAGILAWDPSQTGVITSGRQLFGNMTWQMLFRDGYEALSVLDANRDGELSGRELAGIAVWVDRNGNAVSDAGEVSPASDMGIAALQLRAKRDDANVLMHDKGVRWSDGRITPSYDWLPESK